ncbi:hypothetical protein AABM38_18370 [Heyndrickxia sp. MSNUG]|uniref:hypothetical protein n=1 Tax=Heyndrickxia sp. MSNUG TaxID=3136677 RepID=UPI003C2F5231
MDIKKKLRYTSLVCALVFSFLPTVGLVNGTQKFGIPAQTLALHEGFGFDFNPIALVLNFFFFYAMFLIALKLWKLLTAKVN